MQYHLNGYQIGDPNVRSNADSKPFTSDLPGEVDVLIVGCGPAGLTLAAS